MERGAQIARADRDGDPRARERLLTVAEPRDGDDRRLVRVPRAAGSCPSSRSPARKRAASAVLWAWIVSMPISSRSGRERSAPW